MVLAQHSRWMYATAASGVALGLFNYFQNERKTGKNAWTSNLKPSVKWDYNWDNRHFPKSTAADNINEKDGKERKSKTVPTAIRHIILIRHGQYNLEGKVDAEKILTELGRKQADLVGQRLKDLNFNYTKMIRSTMTRAIETSDIIHKQFPHLPLESCDLLREGAPIPPDPPTSEFIQDEKKYLEDGARIEAAFKKHFHRADPSQEKDSFEIMVCHSNVIRYLYLRLLQFPPEGWFRFNLRHCSITWVVILPSGEVCVLAIGDSGFLSREKMTFN